jgi:hypothetical protein
MAFGFSSVLNAAHSKHHSGHERRGRDGRFHGRYNRAGLTTTGTKGERFAYFGGQKIGELLFGVLLGASQAYGDPLFFSSDPAKAMGPKLFGALVLNGVEAVQLWKGWSLSGLLGSKLGVAADGVIAGGASACWSIYAFDNSNTYFAAKIEQSKGGGATKGVDYSGERRQLHAPSPAAVSPVHRGGENAASRAAESVRKNEFQARMNQADGLAEKARQNPMFRYSFD